MTDVRVAAAGVLRAIERGDETLAAALDRVRPDVAPVDRGLLQELATGTLRWRNELDAVIATAARRSVKSIDPDVLAVLRLGAYQLRHLTRVPTHAVVDGAVRSIKTLRRASAASFVNAVLRAIVRRGPAIALPKRPATADDVDGWTRYLTTTLSHPAWLVRRWIDRYGPEAAETWCVFNNTSPPVTVRATAGHSIDELRMALEAAGVAYRPARYVSDALELPAGTLGSLPADLVAMVRPQDEGAQLVARMAAARPGERILDLCAAPGGKTLVLADDLRCGDPGAGSRLIAADYRAGRVALLCETLSRSHRHLPVVRLDARGPLPFSDTFDAVLVDAPCSGLGTIRREPDLKWSRTAEDLPVLAEGQLRMLHAAAGTVVPGGRIVYATCSSEPEEDAEVVNRFLARDRRFSLLAPDDGRVPAMMLTERGELFTRPDRDGLEVYYAAVLVRL